MTKMFLRCVFLAALAVAVSVPAFAGDLKLSMQNGRVTLIADNVPVRQILQEWSRIGQTRFLNVERVSGPNVTIQLVDAPERDALDILLRSASGYIAAPRRAPLANAAIYDRVTIFVATSRPPAQAATSSSPVPTFQRPPQPDDNDEPINVAMPPQMVSPANPVTQQYPGMPAQPQPAMPPGFPPQLPQQLQQTPTTSPAPGPLTSPRPGALPAPTLPQGVPNPYQPVPRPGGPGGPGGN